MRHATQGIKNIGPRGRETGTWDAVRAPLARGGLAVLLALPGGLIVFFSFNSGGIFEVTTALGTLILLLAMIIGLAVARHPLKGVGPRGLLACGLLALFALWTLLSGDWSNAMGRALPSLNRVVLYLAVLALFTSISASVVRVRWVLRGLLVGSALVSIIGLISRLLPAVWPTTPGLVTDRLSYPITYWNTFALLVGIASILAVHHASDEREPSAVRIGAAALLPILGATLLLTFSRGAIVVTALGIIVYAVVARPRGLLGALLAIVPTTAVAVIQTYSSELIQEGTPLTPAAISQGHDLAGTIGACALVAVFLRLATLPLDVRMSRIAVSVNVRRMSRIVTACTGVVILVALIAGGGASSLHQQYEKFVNDTHEAVDKNDGQRGRLLSIGNDGRLPLWKAALDAYRDNPLKGTGAGTYRLQLEKSRRSSYDRDFAYSLYIEVLSELGLVGIALLAAVFLTMLFAIATRMRDKERPAYAAAFALSLAWIVHAGVDIDWQTPAVCVPVFALGGLACARKPGETQVTSSTKASAWHLRLPNPMRTSPWTRPALAMLCLVIAIFPVRMALAQFHLEKSVSALNADACDQAKVDAHEAISALDTGPRPYEVLAMCAARHGNFEAAVRWANLAVTHDPENWEPHFVLALAQASAGINPRRETAIARQLYPLSPLIEGAVGAFQAEGPKHWQATSATVPFSMF